MKILPGDTLVMLRQLDEEIRAPAIEPGYDKEQAMFFAGKRWVVDYLIKLAGDDYRPRR